MAPKDVSGPANDQKIKDNFKNIGSNDNSKKKWEEFDQIIERLDRLIEKLNRHELGFFAAMRRNFDRIQAYDLIGTTLLGGLDLRYGIGARLDVGIGGTLRANLSDRTASYAIGPQIGFTPAKDLVLIAGYNFAGFKDPDFMITRSTTSGVFISLRLKFDESILSRIGIDPR